MARRSNGGNRGYWFRNGLAALLLGVGILFVVISAFSQVWFGATIDLEKPGYGFIVLGIYIVFGVSLPDLLAGRANPERNEDRDDR